MEDSSEVDGQSKKIDFTTSAEEAILNYDKKFIDHDQKLRNHFTEIQTIRGENKNVVIGVLIAFIFIIVTVGVELMIFHASNDSTANDFQKEYYREIEILKRSQKTVDRMTLEIQNLSRELDELRDEKREEIHGIKK